MRRSIIVLSLCFVAISACAQDNSRMQKVAQEMKERFTKADTNGDGMLTREEAKAMPRVSSHFDEIDANHDGQVSMDEIRAYAVAARQSRGT
jgi:Ca2+-binding EF-hand superfamily protein